MEKRLVTTQNKDFDFFSFSKGDGQELSKIDSFLSHHAIPAPQSIRKLQLFLGKVCNHSCSFCPHEAKPGSSEFMRHDMVHQVISLIEKEQFEEISFKGGAPEMSPYFRWIVKQIRQKSPQTRLVLHTHLTAMNDPGYFQALPRFLQEHQVALSVYVPTLDEVQMDQLRGPKTFKTFLSVVRYLNRLGYASEDSDLKLKLIWKHLKVPNSMSCEVHFEEWKSKWGIRFSDFQEKMYSPVGRMMNCLSDEGDKTKFFQELQTKIGSHDDQPLPCKDSLTIDWEGNVYNCENHISAKGGRVKYRLFHLKDWTSEMLRKVRIQPALHCLSCLACLKN